MNLKMTLIKCDQQSLLCVELNPDSLLVGPESYYIVEL